MFLDRLSSVIENKKFKTKLFDKRDPYPFSMGCMPHLDSNILSNFYYASLASQILRFDRNTSGSNTFITLVNQLLKIIQIQDNKQRFMITMLKCNHEENH